MKALLLKDFFSMKSQIKWIFFIVLIVIGMSFYFEDAMILLAITLIFGTIQITSIFTFDEMSGWDKFANTLPFRKSEIVKSKYILSLLLTVGILLLVCPFVVYSNYVTDSFKMNELFSIICLVVSLSIILLSFIIPTFIKFGTQKARIVLFILVFSLSYGLKFVLDIIALPTLPSVETLQRMSYVSPIFALIILTISYLLSVKLYETKEF
ncbi:ABC-2 transporter permease [Lysinibacillus endophyticus]|uniref:ABC-2 transporter permease n=1 Tax=Ureibacillus endophyticus TaxID=1978490 RepID=UPI00209D27DC|nr:ABC-2 transporter permease [Lysinibacillus endophyticus]MCP1144097.1 ABC-2 transporter permease [Lysinibacillus endophyticus]